MPLEGLEISLGLQGQGDSDALPVAQTCFNTLLLGDYPDFPTLEAKMDLAVAEGQGFGLQ